MTKEYLKIVVNKAREETKNALQTMYDALNQGQQKQIIKNEEVARLFDLYGVEY